MKINLNDNVTCINAEPLKGNDIAPPVKVGDKYPVNEIHTCSCGKEHFNVGLPLDVAHVTCVDCREFLPLTTHWCHPSRFILTPTA